MTQFINLTSQNNSLSQNRCQAYLNALQRKHLLRNGKAVSTHDKKKDSLSVLQKLWDKSRLSFHFREENEVIDILYIPSFESKSVFFESSEGWEANIVKKQKKAFRYSNGAIFSLPIENSEETLDVFITDWSPFPAACLVAIHKDHPLNDTASPRSQKPRFIGKFVRNPLTGDLLPIWVVDWVKPEFGTGAVVINPAHSQVDLQFAKEIGLPIRFSLIEEQISPDPQTWPNPPIVKSGMTIKTGGFDHLSVNEASTAYFKSLEEGKWAKMSTDQYIGSFKIASYTPCANSRGNALISYSHKRFFEKNAPDLSENPQIKKTCERIELNVSNLLHDIMAIGQENQVTLVVSNEEINSTLVFARLLYFDIYDIPLKPKANYVVQSVQETNAVGEADDGVMDFSLLVASPVNQVAVLKKQLFDKVGKFKKVHETFLENHRIQPLDHTTQSFSKIVVRLKDLIELNDFYNAFNELYVLQKQLNSIPPESRAEHVDLSAYYLFAHILSDQAIPKNIDLAETGAQIEF